MSLTRDYLLYILAVLTAIAVITAYTTINHINKNLNNNLITLERKEKKLKLLELQYRNLKETVEKLGIKVLTSKEAIESVLSAADRLVKMYDGRIIRPLEKEDNLYSITVGFDYYPDSAEDLYRFISRLESSVSPIFTVERFELLQEEYGTVTHLEVKISQPFTEGK
ncbi:hypothetical protein [Persephonella sp.]